MAREHNDSRASAPRLDNEYVSRATAASERTPLLSPDVGDQGTNGSAKTSATRRQDPEQQQHEHDHGHEQNDEFDANGERVILAEELPLLKLIVIMGTAWVGVFLGAVDSTIIATLSGPISSEFKSLSLMSWLASAYFISNAACQPISGRLTDIFGRGPGLVFSNVVFAAGNLICGLAQDQRTMIAGRIVAGIGGGGLMSISTFLGSDLVPLRKRGLVQGMGNLCYGTGAMMGGIFGGLINDHTRMGWRLAFLIQVPPVLLSAVAVFFMVKVPPKQSDKSYLSRIDFFGVFLTVSFLVLMLLGLNAGGNLVPWTHPLPLTTIPLSIVAFGGFLWWESTATQPIIPVRLLADRTVLAACFCNFLSTMVVMTGLFYGPLFLQALGSSATTAGLQILPSPVGAATGSMSVGYLMKKTGRYWSMGVGCLVLLVAGVTIFTQLNDQTPVWLFSIAFACVGTGYGAMLTITLLACIAAVDHAHQAVITSATYLGRSLGSTLGVTIGAAVYQNIIKARLWERFGDYPDAAGEIGRIRDDLDELKHLPAGWYPGVLQSFIEAFHGVGYTMLGLGVASLICISLMREHKLHNTLSRES